MRDEPTREVAVADDDRTAALLVRVWLEDGTESFRARVTAVAPTAPAEGATVAVASSPADVLAAVRTWLDEFLGQPNSPE